MGPLCIQNNVCTRVTLFPEMRSNKHQNNTRVSAETVHHQSTHIILFLARHIESINDGKNDDLYTSSQRLTCSVFVLRHNRLLMTSQWPDNCDAITWIVITNSLDIVFIHGDIHDRSIFALHLSRIRMFASTNDKNGMEYTQHKPHI